MTTHRGPAHPTDLERPTVALGRRAFIGAGSAAAVGVLLAACSDDASTPTTADSTDSTTTEASDASDSTEPAELGTGTPDSTVFTAADFAALGVCMLSPQQTEGPFPTETQIERRDVTEGLQGHPLRLGLQVVDESCQAIPGAVVEIWHCDVDGDYSAFADGATSDDAGPGTTFLRGSQTANAEGIVEFVTNYPGWYTGRAVHIHTKVHLGDSTVLTSQIYFPDDYNEQVFTTPPYAVHGPPDTTNSTDSISGGDPAANGSQAAVSTDGALFGTRALLVLGVDPNSSGGRPGRQAVR